MPKAMENKGARRSHKRKPGSPEDVKGRLAILIEPEAKTGQVWIGKARFEAVMKAAEQSGFLSGKSSRIGGRVSPALVAQAKRQTGIETDTDLIEFALASVALEDKFAEVFKEARGKVDVDLKLGF